ncbi:MAG: FAD-binding oxidoreductase [Castellaniella sp.]
MSRTRPITGHPDASSLWKADAINTPGHPPLTESRQTDVLIVGAGFTGLSTALHLAEQGVQSCVLEAHTAGWGASGRNGGQVNPSLRHDPDVVKKMLGTRAEPLLHAIGQSADLVFRLIDQHAIACQPVRQGWIQASYAARQVSVLHKRARQWEALGYPVELLDAAAIRDQTGSRRFHGGWRDLRAGGLQPLSYARGLAQAATAAGARVHEQTPVIALERQGSHWIAKTATGAQVSASRVVLATNAYSDSLWPGLAQTVLAANSFIVATAPMGDAVSYILPRGQTLSTAQRLMVYLRRNAEGRLILGGRGLFHDPEKADDFSHIVQALHHLYPELAPLTIEYRWAGRIAITHDALPHVHRPAPGLTIALGYNGRGVAAATAMGKHLATLLLTESDDDFPFPITAPGRIPLHGLQRLYLSAGIAWYGLLDRLAR